MTQHRQLLLVLTIGCLGLASIVCAPIAAESRPLEQRVQRLEDDVDDLAETGLVLFLFGAFCALWAQNTGREPWGWFFFGLFLGPIAAVVLLSKNSAERKEPETGGA